MLQARTAIVAVADYSSTIRPHGTPYKDWRTAFSTALKRAGIENFRFHDLRHTYISRLAVRANGAMLQGLARHKGPGMTHRYTHFNQQHVRNIVSRTFDEPNQKPWESPGPRRSITLTN